MAEAMPVDKFGRPITPRIQRRRQKRRAELNKNLAKYAKAGGLQNAKRWEKIKQQREEDLSERLLAGIDRADELMRGFGWRVY